MNIFIGSYNEKDKNSIYCYDLDTQKGILNLKSECNLVENPSYLAMSKDKSTIYAVSETSEFNGKFGGAVAVLTYKNGEFVLDDIKATDGDCPCHVLIDKDEKYLYVSNYMSGDISVYRINDDKTLVMTDFVKHFGSGPNKERQESAHMHYCGFIDDKVCAVDLGIDKIKCYDNDTGKLKLVNEIDFPKGVGVRHFLVDNKNPNIIFVVCELSSEVIVVEKQGNDFNIIQRISCIPEKFKDSFCAAIKQSENGKYVLVSNRGHDSIVVFEWINNKLEFVKYIDVKGKFPRDFLLLKDYIIVANQNSDNVVLIKFNQENADIEYLTHDIYCQKPVCVIK